MVYDAIGGQDPGLNIRSAFHEKRRRRWVDRRSGDDRRVIYSLNYFAKGGVERRIGDERRQQGERRADCFRVTRWSSICP